MFPFVSPLFWNAKQMNGKRDVVQLRAVCNHTNTLVSEAYPDNLEMYVLREQNRPIRDIVTMSLDAARGLRALHDHPGAPIVHFDIKPSQVWYSFRNPKQGV